MEEHNFSFKVVFKGDNDDPEIRRFVVDRDVSTSIDYLREKLTTVFPVLRRTDFRFADTERQKHIQTEIER